VVESYYNIPEMLAPFDGSAMVESDAGFRRADRNIRRPTTTPTGSCAGALRSRRRSTPSCAPGDRYRTSARDRATGVARARRDLPVPVWPRGSPESVESGARCAGLRVPTSNSTSWRPGRPTPDRVTVVKQARDRRRRRRWHRAPPLRNARLSAMMNSDGVDRVSVAISSERVGVSTRSNRGRWSAAS
jgi:hypothetical protein